MGSTERFGTSTSDRAIPVSCIGGLLLFITDRRGSCGSLATRKPFLLLLSIHGSRMMIYMTSGCTTRIISFQQPRVVPQAPQMDIPHVTEPRASLTSAEEPRHAVKVCDDIAERLECHLSLWVVTPSSSTHEAIEECLRIHVNDRMFLQVLFLMSTALNLSIHEAPPPIELGGALTVDVRSRQQRIAEITEMIHLRVAWPCEEKTIRGSNEKTNKI
ncbi:hypothetical protein D0Y65_030330 [Glycine soja]|uniref:Uncharacterized protein n=1 Tax=Glycine soja TaxID=3848 RepID=A0A445I3D6_GLYSO|nr:hypothetical protein D0Y65_030330 [Glycine soja]